MGDILHAHAHRMSASLPNGCHRSPASAHPLPRPLAHRRIGHPWLLTIVLALVVVLFSGSLMACSSGIPTRHVVTIATISPASGPESSIGQSMTRAVDLAVQQNAALGGGLTLTTIHLDESSIALSANLAQTIANPAVLGVVGPLSSSAAVTALPILTQAGVVTISPTAMLPGLTHADQAAVEGVTFAQLHPQGKPVSFFRLTADDSAAATAAARLALAPPAAHGLGARTAFIVADGSPSGKAQAAAFQAAFTTSHGIIVGSRRVTQDDEISMQSAVSAVIEANPDMVFFAGDPTVGADLRRTLTQTGAPQLGLLVVGSAADDPAWSDNVGGAILSGNTTGLLPARDLTQLPSASDFVQAYHHAYPGVAPTPQSALAYDAAMDEISALKALLAAQRTPTRANVLAMVAHATYAGITGQIAFDPQGDIVRSPEFSVYTCDTNGVWHFQTSAVT